MKQKIEGSIKYCLEFGDGHADLQYETSLDNDLAILAAASHIMQNHFDATKIKRESAKFLHKRLLADELELLKRGKDGIRRTLNQYLELYNEYQDSLKNPPPTIEDINKQDEDFVGEHPSDENRN